MASVVRDDYGNGSWVGILLVTSIIAIVSGTASVWLNDRLNNNFHLKQITDITTNFENELTTEREARKAVEDLNKKAQKDIDTAYIVSTALQESVSILRARNEEASNCLGLVIPNQLRQ
jgi:hypothetical protein